MEELEYENQYQYYVTIPYPNAELQEEERRGSSSKLADAVDYATTNNECCYMEWEGEKAARPPASQPGQAIRPAPLLSSVREYGGMVDGICIKGQC